MATALNEPQADDLLEPSQAQLQSWLDAALTVAGQQPGATAAVRILTVAEMGELNQRFRGRTGPTNSLAFPVETEIPNSVEAATFSVTSPCAARSSASRRARRAFGLWSTGRT